MASFLDGYGGYCTCTRGKCSNDCATYRRYKPKPVTNYDRIISKSPEELADWLIGVIQRGGVIPYGGTGVTLDWLRQEARP